MANDRYINLNVTKINHQSYENDMTLNVDDIIIAVDKGSEVEMFYEAPQGLRPKKFTIDGGITLADIVAVATATGYDHPLRILNATKFKGQAYSPAKPLLVNQRYYGMLTPKDGGGTIIEYKTEMQNKQLVDTMEVTENLVVDQY